MGSALSKHPDEIKASQQQHQPSPSLLTAPRHSTSEQVNENDSETGGGGCPMKRTDGSYSYDWKALFRPDFPHRSGGDPSQTTKTNQQEAEATAEKATASSSTTTSTGGCPVKASSSQSSLHPQYNVYSQPILDPSNQMPSVANQLPAPRQNKPLSTERVASSIPKGGSSGNDPSNSSATTWTYPSPQMFYNALARKGKLGDTSEEDISNVVTLHNHMNEKTWRKILQWEQVMTGHGGASDSNTSDGSGSAANDNDPPKLLRFQGRPMDLSPKAAIKHYLLGHPLPYDRHDWTIVHERDGSTRRYVIDYYHDESRTSNNSTSEDDNDMKMDKDARATPSLLVDVRPAADTLSSIYSRFIGMPYARHIANSTTFTPLPLLPTPSMKSQVQESVQVWQSIQQQASGRGQADEHNAQDVSPHLTESQARTLAREFAQVVSDCRAQQRRVNECRDDMECARASMDLTVCMGKIVCPLQHGALTKALSSSYDGDSKIEAALQVMNDCVQLKTVDHKSAKELYPKLFTKS